VKVAVLKALATIPDEKVRGEAVEMLKGADALLAKRRASRRAPAARAIRPRATPRPSGTPR
jgi:hypothetical protein